MRDGRLADVTAGGEVAGADLGKVAQLAEDRESGRVSGGLEEKDVGVGLALHVPTVLTDAYVDKYQYSHHGPSASAGGSSAAYPSSICLEHRHLSFVRRPA